MQIAEGHRQITDKLKQLAQQSPETITDAQWAQDRQGEFLVFHVNGNRRVIDISREDADVYPGDPDVRRRIDKLLSDVIGGISATI